jgi:hypothetical protein
MSGYTPLLQSTFEWEDDYGAEGFPDIHLARLEAVGMKVSVVKGEAGSIMPPHAHSHGAITYVVEGRVEIDGTEYGPGDAAVCAPRNRGQGQVNFLTDGTYLTIRRGEDEMRTWDQW